MSEAPANIKQTSSAGEAHLHSHPQPVAPLPSHAAGVADSYALPPALTPATTTRHSVALGMLSTFWGHNSTSLNIAIPSDATQADAHERHYDLATSTGSVPSTTTTLTNTLPPLQSAAIRALNAPAFHAQSKPAKSTSSRTTVTSQPVVVRTYSGSRHTSRPGSGFNTPRSFAMNSNANASALSAGLARQEDQLPAIEDFSFSAILRAVDPEIRDAIDAIAEICARSRLSLADEYDAHLPPQGEITGAGPGWAASTGALVGRGRLSRVNLGWTAADNTLMAVPEASSSSERLAQDGKSTTAEGKNKRSQSAYGSLKSVISGGSSGIRKSIDDNTFEQPQSGSSRQDDSQRPPGPAWAIRTASQTQDHPAIILEAPPQASKQLAFESSVLEDLPETDSTWGLQPRTAATRPGAAHRRNWSMANEPTGRAHPRVQSNMVSSLTSWLPWPLMTTTNDNAQQERNQAESRLREMLQTHNIGKGRSAAGAT